MMSYMCRFEEEPCLNFYHGASLPGQGEPAREMPSHLELEMKSYIKFVGALFEPWFMILLINVSCGTEDSLIFTMKPCLR